MASTPTGGRCACDGSGALLIPAADTRGWIVSARYGDRALVLCPGCAAGRTRAQAWKNLPDEAAGVRLATLHAKAHQQPAIAAIARLLVEPAGWLTLAGDYGTGKTTLIYACLNALGDQGTPGRYTTAPELLDHLRDGMRDTAGQSPSSRLQGLIEAPCLAVDEVDKYQATEFAEQAIFRLFDARYRARASSITLLGYNHEREDRIPPFLASRMRDGRFQRIVMHGTDIRPTLTRPLDAWDRGE